MTTRIERLQKELDAFCKEAVPDKRVDFCRVSVKKGTGNRLMLKGELLSPELKKKILKLAQSRQTAVTDSIILLPERSVSGKPWGLVTLSVANLKTEPSHGSEMASQAIMGTPVRILKADDDWLFVQTPDHYLAWVGSSSVQTMDQQELEQWRKSERVFFPGNYGLVYKDTVDFGIVSDLVAGSILVKTADCGSYCQVSLPDHRTGFIPGKQVISFDQWKNRDQTTGEKLVDTAKKFLGLPYMWGGTSSKAVDCSGFMKNVWFLNGIILERDASQQFKHGQEIDPGMNFENLQPGDMMFFGKKQPVRIIHTGLYIGNREVIHSSGRVRINSMDPQRANYSRYLGGTFVGARRVIGQPAQFGIMPVKEHPWY